MQGMKEKEEERVYQEEKENAKVDNIKENQNVVENGEENKIKKAENLRRIRKRKQD
jgi:hypothetical protein